MRSRGYYKNQTRFDRRLGAKPCNGKNVINDPHLIVDVIENLRKLDDNFRKWNLEDGINWILGLESYVKDKNGTLNQRYSNNHFFKRGDIVLVDFFGHFGTELTYEHPSIVLEDKFDGVVIAPISSSCYKDGVGTHIDLQKNIADLGNVKNNCGIKIEQLRFISKSRILNKFNRVSNNDKLNEIDEVLMKLLAPIAFNNLVQHQQQLLTELSKKNTEIQLKDKEIDRLEKLVQLLEQQINESDENVS